MMAWIRGCVAALSCVALWSCGGSSSDDAQPGSRSVVTVGPITGFGSIIVNGIRFDDRAAAITINDRVATREQLKLGMVVAVDGSVGDCPIADSVPCEGVAARVRFRNNVEGPITALDRLTGTLRVMGRELVVDDATVFDGAGVTGLESLNVGDLVAVSAMADRDRLRVHLLDRIGAFVDGTTPVVVHGLVASVDLALGTCSVDGVPVRFGGLGPGDLPAGGLAAGQYVAAQGRGFGSGLMTADRIQLRDRISYPDASLVQVEGYVSGFVSVADFAVDGQRVDARDAIFVHGSSADLEDGVRVEVEGAMAATVLIASKVIFRLDASMQVVAPVQSKDVGAAALTVLGQGVLTTPLTRFRDFTSIGHGPPTRSFGYADLGIGDRVDVRAFRDTAGRWVATRVERTAPDPLLIARGPASSKLPAIRLNLFGVDVHTGPATRYRDLSGELISDITFYGLVQVPPAVPSVVRAQGIATSSSPNAIDATRTTTTRGEVELAR